MTNLEHYYEKIEEYMDNSCDTLTDVVIDIMKELNVDISKYEHTLVAKDLLVIEWLLDDYKSPELSDKDKKFLHDFLAYYDYPDFSLRKYEIYEREYLDIEMVMEVHKDENGHIFARGTQTIVIPLHNMQVELFKSLENDVIYTKEELMHD